MGRKLDSQLTKRQQEVYDYIRETMRSRGYAPSVREIAAHFNIESPNGVVCHLHAIERKGYLRRVKDKARALELPHGIWDDEPKGLPLAGVVAAGPTQLAFEQNERIDFSSLFHGQKHFALRVSGNSMIEAHITDGDYVIVRTQETAKPGQMVVARTPDGEATLKYWYPERKRIRLQPANSQMPPIYVTEATVVGVVVGIVRNL